MNDLEEKLLFWKFVSKVSIVGFFVSCILAKTIGTSLLEDQQNLQQQLETCQLVSEEFKENTNE